MKKIAVALLILSASIFNSCKEEDRAAWEELNYSFRAAAQNTFTHTGIAYHALESRLLDPVQKERAMIWQLKAMRLREISGEMYDYIETLERRLTESDYETKEGTRAFKQGGNAAVKSIFVTQGKAAELEEKLHSYSVSILNIDPEINKAFSQSLPTGAFIAARTKATTATFIKTCFNGSAYKALTMLSNLQSKVRLAENQLACFCLNKTAVTICTFPGGASPLIGQSSSYVQPGEKIEIMAGIGDFSAATNPKIAIDNKIIPLNANAIAVGYVKASSLPGRHPVSIKIDFLNPDGTKATMEKNIWYVVAGKVEADSLHRK